MVAFELFYTRRAQKDAKKLERAGLKPRVQNLLDLLRENPWQTPPPYEKLIGELAGAYSRRINIKHRLVYEVFEERRAIKVLSMWSHYE